MAVAFDGFSIRDYTSKMRSIDVFKCWPFRTDDVSREDVESWLPPMAVPKPRCCSNELEATRSDCDDDDKPMDEEISRSESDQQVKSEERLEMVCPVCRVFNAATLTAVNAHIDGCLAQTMREERRQMKSKSKAPKKRSIAEIFEVQEQEEPPKIETVLKLWPFRENPDEVSITVTKFKWWSRQLEAMRSNNVDGEISRNDAECVKSNASIAAEEEKLEMVCPVCRDFNAATVTAVNAHIDSCLAQAMREERRQMKMNLKLKPKAPKKRSIAEILTVAPQIKATDVEVDKEEEDEEEEEEEENKKEEKYDYGGGYSSGIGAVAVFSTIKSKKNTNKRKKKRMKKLKRKSKEENYRVESLNNGKKMMKNKKKKKMMNNELIAKKEDAYKRKVQTPVNNPRRLKGTIGNERVAVDDIDASTLKKKSSLKSLSVEKKQKIKTFDSVGNQRKAVPPVHGILNNHSEHISGRTPSDCNIEHGTEDSHCDVQVMTSDRHVRFSGKDDICGQKRGDLSDETMFNLSSDAMATSLEKQSSGSEEAAEVNRSDDNSTINVSERKEVCPVVEDEQFSCTPEQIAGEYILRARTNQEKSKHLVEKPESLSDINLNLFDRGNANTVHYSPYAGIPGTLCALQPGQISSLNTQMCDSGAFSSTVKFVDHWKDPTHQLSTVNSSASASARTFLEPSSSSASYSEANKRPQLPSQFYGDCDNIGQALGDRPSSRLFSAGMVDNSFSLPGWGKGSVRNNCMDESIFGLPLNSHGELINFSSSGKVGMNQPHTSSASRVSSRGLPVNNIVSRSRQEYLRINERDFVHKTLRKDCEDPFPHYPARLGVTELQSIEKADIHRPNSDSMSTSNHFARPLDSDLNLMRNSLIEQNQHNLDEKHKGNQLIYLKESSDPISLSSSQPTVRLMGKDVPISRSSKEMKQFVEDACAGEVSTRHCSKDAALENSFLGRCSKQNLISGSPSQISTENLSHSVKIHSNQASQINYVSQNGVSRNASSYLLPIAQAPTSCAAFDRAPHDMPKQFISEAKQLGLSPQLQRSYRSLPPWLLSSTHEKLPGTPQQISGLSCKSSPHSKWGGNFTAPSVNHSAVVYPPNPLTSHCQMMTSPCLASIVQPPHFPVTSVTRPSFSINSGDRNVITFADRVELDDMTIEDHRCTNTRKRPAANLDDSTPAIMLPNIEVQENLSCMSGLTRETRSAEMQGNTRAVELDPRGDGARRKYCQQNEAQSIRARSYPGMQSFKSDDMISSGPVRLSRGAKHILIPSQNTEQDNSRLIHSSIPIAATTDRGRDIEIQGKLTKIYRL